MDSYQQQLLEYRRKHAEKHNYKENKEENSRIMTKKVVNSSKVSQKLQAAKALELKLLDALENGTLPPIYSLFGLYSAFSTECSKGSPSVIRTTKDYSNIRWGKRVLLITGSGSGRNFFDRDVRLAKVYVTLGLPQEIADCPSKLNVSSIDKVLGFSNVLQVV